MLAVTHVSLVLVDVAEEDGGEDERHQLDEDDDAGRDLVGLQEAAVLPDAGQDKGSAGGEAQDGPDDAWDGVGRAEPRQGAVQRQLRQEEPRGDRADHHAAAQRRRGRRHLARTGE